MNMKQVIHVFCMMSSVKRKLDFLFNRLDPRRDFSAGFSVELMISLSRK
jgi:hypothetical protein